MERFSSKVKASVWQKTGGRCWYCGIQTNPFSSGFKKIFVNKDFCIDHVIPRKHKGGDELENLVPACWTCNNRKRDMTVEEFRKVISQYHGLATTQEFANWRKGRWGFGDKVTRLVFYFETLQTKNEEILKQGADEIFFFTKPDYLTKKADRDWRRFERERGLR